MDDEQNQHRDRYDTSGNPEAEYVNAANTVLRNKLGITDLARSQVWEEESLTTTYEVLLHEVRLDTPMTCELLKHIHQRTSARSMIGPAVGGLCGSESRVSPGRRRTSSIRA